MNTDQPTFFSIRAILENYDYLSNWLTCAATAGIFAAMASFYDKVTGAAILLALFTSTGLAMTFWPVLLERGYGGLQWTLLFGFSCGVAGASILHTMIYIVRRRVTSKLENLADGVLGKEQGGDA